MLASPMNSSEPSNFIKAIQLIGISIMLSVCVCNRGGRCWPDYDPFRFAYILSKFNIDSISRDGAKGGPNRIVQSVSIKVMMNHILHTFFVKKIHTPTPPKQWNTLRIL